MPQSYRGWVRKDYVVPIAVKLLSLMADIQSVFLALVLKEYTILVIFDTLCLFN